jgi:hypothetical protein
MKMEIQEFEEAVRKDDFAIGDSFWLGDWEFEVVNRRQQDGLFCRDEAVFKWQLTAEDFVAAIKGNHTEIENPEEFFSRHKNKIIHHFAKGFDILVGGCGATYGSLMNDAIDEIIEDKTSDTPPDEVAEGQDIAALRKNLPLRP